MSVEAVILDWGGTLTPFHTIDLLDLWRVAARVLAAGEPARVEEIAVALAGSEGRRWDQVMATGKEWDDG